MLAPIALLHEHFRFDTSAAFTGSLLWMIFLNSGASFVLFFMLLRRGAAHARVGAVLSRHADHGDHGLVRHARAHVGN